jgi:hypothetical protein
MLPPPVCRPDCDAAQHRRVAVLVEHRHPDDDAAVLEDHPRSVRALWLEPQRRRREPRHLQQHVRDRLIPYFEFAED